MINYVANMFTIGLCQTMPIKLNHLEYKDYPVRITLFLLETTLDMSGFYARNAVKYEIKRHLPHECVPLNDVTYVS